MTQFYLPKSEDYTSVVRCGNGSFKIRLYGFRGLVYADISRGNEKLVTGERVLPNQWLLPFYMMGDAGNFRFETYAADGDDYVWYEGFNDKFRFVVYKAAEVTALLEEANSKK